MLLYLKTIGNETTSVHIAFVWYFELTPPLDAVGKDLICTSPRWPTDGELDHTRDLGGMPMNKMEARKWFDVVPFSSIVSVHSIVRSYYCETLLMPRLACPSNLLCTLILADYALVQIEAEL